MIKLISLSILSLLAWALSGCANIPYDRTWSFTYSDGKQSLSAGVKLEAPKGLKK